ncbi:hypothetical protein HYV86_01380 [Candidatus Woesearchaeota archaeon]|nr:hypothetical protein [Candidatus Woesearchaeota archaeon]
MIITIDTKADSVNDIRKAIAFLQLHIEDAPDFGYKSSQSSHSSSITPVSSTPVDTTSMMNMFDDNSESSSSSSSSSYASASTTAANQRISDGSAPDFSSFLNLTKKEKSGSLVPPARAQIEFY